MNRKKVAICCTLNAVIKKICDVDLIYMNLKVYMNLLIIYMMEANHHAGSINFMYVDTTYLTLNPSLMGSLRSGTQP